MGHHSCCNKQKVKRGLWSPEEDEKLVNFISTNGHGCWSSVPNLSGLQRCGKSCRLRWINYLRPDLKRGDFSKEEVTLILALHKNIGNKWAQIARYLPGRTDNEVKNFWNSVIKKKMFSNGECNERVIYTVEEKKVKKKDVNLSSSLSSSSSSKGSWKMKNIPMKDCDSWIEQMIGLQFEVINHQQNDDDGVLPYSVLQPGSTTRIMDEFIDDDDGIIIGDHVGVDDVELCSEFAWESVAPGFLLPSSTMFI